MRRTVLLPLPLTAAFALAAGCVPHDGEVSGDYVSYFAAGSSENIYRLEAKLYDFSEESTRNKFQFEPVDCRPLDDEDERLSGVDFDAECQSEPDYFPWLNQYSYYVRTETYDPWRVEAVMTTEGDLQLTVHHEVSNIGDLRFGWVVDPDFQPTECVDGESGSEIAAVEGEDWIGNWSAAEGGTMIHLNAFGFQVNPSDTSDYWFLPETWMAGYGFGRMADEDLYGHAIDYIDNISIDPETGYSVPLYQPTYDGHWDSSNTYENFVENLTEAVTYDADHPSDLAAIGKSDFPVDIKIEENSWRPDVVDDDSPDGFANWVGMDPTWVHFDMEPSELALVEAGKQDKPITGTFQLYLESASAASKVLVNGSFSIDHVRKDIWGYSPSLVERKVEENNTPTCGEDRLTTDEE